MRDDEGQGDLRLAELLERSFGAGPDGLPTPVDRLADGRRALRRRHRAGIAATAVGVVTVVGVVYSGVMGGGSDADGQSPQLATSGTSATPSVTPSSTPSDGEQRELERLARKARERAHRVEQREVSNQFPAAYGSDGSVIVKDGWHITQRVEEPMGYLPPEASVGLALSDGGHSRWLLLEHQRAQDAQGHPLPDAFGDSRSADDPGAGYSRFEDWLASMVELHGGAATAPLLVVDSADAVQAGTGAQLLAVRVMPVVEGYSDQGDRMAEVRRDGRTWFVVIRGHGPDAEVIPVDADLLPEPTFAAFLDHVRDQSASGEGLR